jgi:hypothetical protein
MRASNGCRSRVVVHASEVNAMRLPVLGPWSTAPGALMVRTVARSVASTLLGRNGKAPHSKRRFLLTSIAARYGSPLTASPARRQDRYHGCDSAKPAARLARLQGDIDPTRPDTTFGKGSSTARALKFIALIMSAAIVMALSRKYISNFNNVKR